jgi:hypothetical protein
LSFVVNKMCQYLHEPRTPHMAAVWFATSTYHFYSFVGIL